MIKLRDMFRKEPACDANERTGAWDGALSDGHRLLTSGLIAGTKVATEIGWRDVEALQAGDKVLTFDDGLQTVRKVSRRWTYQEPHLTPEEFWPLDVPEGALGNRTGLILLPDQPVMMESDSSEATFGDPFTLIPARALEGYKGIDRLCADIPVEVVALHFDTEQVVFGNIGALFYCPAKGGASDACAAPRYEALPLTLSRMFVAALAQQGADGGVTMPAPVMPSQTESAVI
ncbi:Hint domain-containing protein [Celeribacter halophilus]|uniref:Hint domain-containing protein n=1 Tax=Celeribacter halophilus TaxID=576117 RepID=UPI002FD39DF0